ncbi:hypothetical protein ACLOJK_037396 [Asimina triloba]
MDRYCTEKAFFSVKEVDRGLVADLGVLQRLPGIIGFGNTMELALTGRNFSGLEAKEMNLVSRVFSSKEEMEEGVRMVAEVVKDCSESSLGSLGSGLILVYYWIFSEVWEWAYTTVSHALRRLDLFDSRSCTAYLTTTIFLMKITKNIMLGLITAIAEKSPVAVTGTKQVLLRTRDLTVDQGLDYVAAWNSVMLFTNDLKEAIKAYTQKRKPVFAKL